MEVTLVISIFWAITLLTITFLKELWNHKYQRFAWIGLLPFSLGLFLKN